MQYALMTLIKRLDSKKLLSTNVISWGAPVPAFGDLSRSLVATLGLNPSNREFVDDQERELDGIHRRFCTLRSLGISQWSDVDANHVGLILESCRSYFHRNPYDGWFRELNSIISGTNYSYYGNDNHACHLDLIPYATACKWTKLTAKQRSLLLELSEDTLGLLLQNSPIRLLILNGKTVVRTLERISGVEFSNQKMPSWNLPRKSGSDVSGFAYRGTITKIANVQLNRGIAVLGFNHNIQSSFGVTHQVKNSIQSWITRSAAEVLLET